MPDVIGSILFVLHTIVAVCAIVAVYLAYKLYTETDRGWYWLSLLMSAFFFALSEWIIVFLPLIPNFAIITVLRELSEIAAVFLFAISCLGIYMGMKEIRKLVE